MYQHYEKQFDNQKIVSALVFFNLYMCLCVSYFIFYGRNLPCPSHLVYKYFAGHSEMSDVYVESIEMLHP